jgi:cell division protein FtsQ
MNAIVMTNTVPEEKLSVVKRDNNKPDKTGSHPLTSLVFIFLVMVFFVLAGWRLLDPATLPIRHVRIEGNFQHLLPEKMQTMVTEVISGGFFNLNVSSINNALLQEPWVDWVSVQRVWPDSLNVQVKEQTAIGHWNEKGLLNASAQTFYPQEAELIPGLPFLSGPVDTQNLVLDRYKQIQQALSALDIHIRSVSLSERRAWRLELQDGLQVILGRSDVENRITRFTGSVLPGLGDKINKVKQIDMRYTNGFAVAWKNESSQITESRLKNNG